MHRFHFHFHDDDGIVVDDEGIELPDADAASREAARQVREMVAQEVRETGIVHLARRLEVHRGDGVPVGPLEFRAIITVKS